MAKRAITIKNVDKKDRPTTGESKENDNRKKIVAGVLILLGASLFIWWASPLAIGDIEIDDGDGVAPIITCNKDESMLINTGDFEFFVESDLPVSSFLMYYNGSSSYTNLSSPYIYPISLNGVGTVSFTTVVYDSADLRTVETFSFSFDAIPPSVYISPSNGSITEDNEFSVTTSVDVETVRVITDGYDQTFTNSSFTVMSPWASLGTKMITINATDIAGNSIVNIFELIFYVEPPQIVISQTTNSSIVTLTVSSYATLVMIGNSSSAINVTIYSPYIVDMNWSSDGVYEIWVFVNSSLGISYTRNKTVVFDTTSPSFTVSPINGSIVNSTLMIFTPIDATSVQAFVDGTNITMTMTYAPLYYIDGTYSFNVTMIDAAGNVNHSILSYTFNFKIPDIYISPVNGSTTSDNEFDITTDTDVVEVRIFTDNNFTMYTPSFTIMNPWNTTGMKTMTVTAIDVAGNANTTIFVLYFDIPEPYILYYPITNSSNFTIIVNDYTDVVMVGNTSSTINTTVSYPYNVDMNWSTDGIHEMWVYINTTVGESYTLNITVTYDTTNPIFTVVPINGSAVNMTSLVFTPIDLTSVQAFVNGTNITSTMTYTPAWSGNGTYYFNVTMVDAAGNVNLSTLMYILDTDSPIITLLYVSNGSVITNSTITVLVTDVSLDSVSVSLDNSSFVILSNGTDPFYSADLSVNFTSIGWYDIYFYADDEIGHVTYIKYTFFWTIPVPQNITIIEPTNATVDLYIDPSYSDFAVDKTEFIGYFNQTNFNWINFSIPYVINSSMVYLTFYNVTGAESVYNQTVMNSTFNLLRTAYQTNNVSFQQFSFNGSIFSFSATTYLDGNSSWRFYIYYSDSLNEAIGTFVIVYDDKTPVISWTLKNDTTSKLNQNTYINFTTTDINLYSMHIVVKVTNSSGTVILYNMTVYGSKLAFFGLNFTMIQSRLPYYVDVDVLSTDLAGNTQSVHLEWKVDAKNPPDRNAWNFLWGLGIPAIVIFGILGYALKKSKNNGSSIGGI